MITVTAATETENLVVQATALLRQLVDGGAALGWLRSPTESEVGSLLRAAVEDAAEGDACLVVAMDDDTLMGLGYWRRYGRPTHLPNADIEKVAVGTKWQGLGIGRQLTQTLIQEAANAGVEQLTLDVRGDNSRAAALYESLGFSRYGTLKQFIAFGDVRYDKIFYVLDLRD